MDLIESSNKIFYSLNKFDEEKKEELFNELALLVQGTSIDYLTGVFYDTVKFKKEQGRYPEPNYFITKFPQVYQNPLENSFSFDIVYEMISTLKREKARIGAIQALGDDDFETAKNHLGDDISGVSIEEFGIDGILESYDQLTSRPAGIITGVKEIDEILKGFSYGTLNVIAAPPGNFKSTYCMSILYNACFKLGFNMVFLSLEGRPEDIWFSFLSRHSHEIGTPLSAEKLKKGLLTEEEKGTLSNVKESWEANGKGKISVISPFDMAGFSTSTFQRFLEEKNAEAPLDGLVIDYLNLMKFYKPRGVDTKEIMNYYVRYFTSLAVNFGDKGLAVVLLAQINREGWKRLEARKQASLFHFAEANELERSSHTAMILYASDDMKLSNQVGITVVKNRSGRIMDEMSVQYVNPDNFIVGDPDFENVFSLESVNILESNEVDNDLFI